MTAPASPAARAAGPVAPVAIVGAGPVGLSLALGLARQGVRSVLVEREPTTREHSRAPVIHVRTREVLRRLGVEDRLLAAGTLRTGLDAHAAGSGRALLSLDFAALEVEAERPGVLVLEQARTERLLLDAVRETGFCDLRFGTEAVALEQGGEGVALTARGARGTVRIDARYLVGCDGAGSFVRGALGLPFEGMTYGLRPLLADVRVADGRDALPWPRIHDGGDGVTAGVRLSPGLWRLIRIERGAPGEGEAVAAGEVAARVEEVLGPGAFDEVWSSRFRIHRRSSPRFRAGRVVLAGDAAHVHSPAGGLGMNGGIQDAHTLAWMLAAALRGGDAGRLLDAYDVERRAVMVEGVSRHADRLTRGLLAAPAPLRGAALGALRVLLAVPALRRRALRRTAMLDLAHPPSPLLDRRERGAGARLPDPLLRAADGGRVRLYRLLPTGPVLLELGSPPPLAEPLPVEAVLRVGPGGYDDPSGLLRRLAGFADGRVLVRPDAYVAWARPGDGADAAAVRRALGA